MVHSSLRIIYKPWDSHMECYSTLQNRHNTTVIPAWAISSFDLSLATFLESFVFTCRGSSCSTFRFLVWCKIGKCKPQPFSLLGTTNIIIIIPYQWIILLPEMHTPAHEFWHYHRVLLQIRFTWTNNEGTEDCGKVFLALFLVGSNSLKMNDEKGQVFHNQRWKLKDKIKQRLNLFMT